MTQFSFGISSARGRAGGFAAALKGIIGAAMLCVASGANAGLIAIINNASATSEPGTTANITANLDSLLQAAGNTTAILDTIPADLTPYDQIWDIGFSNNAALSASEEAQYLSYLQGGGGIFLMGENAGFVTRNNSVLSLIAAAGGGSLTFAVPSSTQSVVIPFTGPNPVSTVTYAAPGGVTSAGSGQFITVDGGGVGAGVAFGVGDLANALDGALTTIFDVNFMEGTFNQPNSQNLLKNLIQFVEEEVDPEPMPVPATLALMGLGLLVLSRRKR